jgi:hypothetical protein
MEGCKKEDCIQHGLSEIRLITFKQEIQLHKIYEFSFYVAGNIASFLKQFVNALGWGDITTLSICRL